MRPNKPTKIAMVFFGLLLFSAPASANVIIPALFAGWLGMILMLIPVIFVEALVLSMGFGYSAISAIQASAFANGISTIVGIPIASALLTLHQPQWIEDDSVDDFANGYGGDGYDQNEDDESILRGFGILIFFFLSSWAIEYWLIGRYEWLPESQLFRAIFVANSVSYGLLFVFIVAMTISTPNESKVEVAQSTAPQAEVTQKLADPDAGDIGTSPNRQAVETGTLASIRSIEQQSRFRKNSPSVSDEQTNANPRTRDRKTHRVA